MTTIRDEIRTAADRVHLVEYRSESQPPWATEMFNETVECYRRDFEMSTPMPREIINQHERGSIIELFISESEFDYMSPMHILRPRQDRMDVVPVKIDYTMTESVIEFRQVDEQSGTLVPSIDDEKHREIIEKLLTRILPDSIYGEGVLERALRPDFMEFLWIPAFTHKSYNPNKDQNYERLEYMGDGVMGLSFRTYMARHYPELNEAEYTAIASHYLSTSEQAKIADQLQLISAVRSNVIPDRAMAEDLLEAFYGVLYRIFRLELVHQFTENIYGEVGIDLSYRHQDPKTNVLQYFERRQLIKPIEHHENLPDGSIVTSLIVQRDDVMRRLLEYLPGLPYEESPRGNIIVRGNPSSIQRTAALSAYNKMYDLITTFGTFELDAPILEEKYRTCLDRLYSNTHRDYQPIVIGGGPGTITMAIQATNRTTELLDNIVTMNVPVQSRDQRRAATRTFLESICRAIDNQ